MPKIVFAESWPEDVVRMRFYCLCGQELFLDEEEIRGLSIDYVKNLLICDACMAKIMALAGKLMEKENG